ncbi:diamine acetyltransferase 2-like [Xenopus tropicalis]|uniref:Diamine acetyltransferase 2-like n=1 Tax=Xenopus tropicalis TaxID=8364 RepID=A0A803J3X5_XENTR|nr:diamine acetyltransferase 2-like [Xenopus tropicalis]
MGDRLGGTPLLTLCFSIDLHRDGFGATPWFRCIVAEVPEKERAETGAPFAGYALFANSYSSWTGRTLHLEDLYVSPHFRGRGLGRLLMKKVAQEALRSGCSQIHLTVLKWNDPAIQLYRSLGAESLTEEPGYQVMSFKLEALRRMGEESAHQ